MAPKQSRTPVADPSPKRQRKFVWRGQPFDGFEPGFIAPTAAVTEITTLLAEEKAAFAFVGTSKSGKTSLIRALVAHLGMQKRTVLAIEVSGKNPVDVLAAQMCCSTLEVCAKLEKLSEPLEPLSKPPVLIVDEIGQSIEPAAFFNICKSLTDKNQLSYASFGTFSSAEIAVQTSSFTPRPTSLTKTLAFSKDEVLNAVQLAMAYWDTPEAEMAPWPFEELAYHVHQVTGGNKGLCSMLLYYQMEQEQKKCPDSKSKNKWFVLWSRCLNIEARYLGLLSSGCFPSVISTAKKHQTILHAFISQQTVTYITRDHNLLIEVGILDLIDGNKVTFRNPMMQTVGFHAIEFAVDLWPFRLAKLPKTFFELLCKAVPHMDYQVFDMLHSTKHSQEAQIVPSEYAMQSVVYDALKKVLPVGHTAYTESCEDIAGGKRVDCFFRNGSTLLNEMGAFLSENQQIAHITKTKGVYAAAYSPDKLSFLHMVNWDDVPENEEKATSRRDIDSKVETIWMAYHEGEMKIQSTANFPKPSCCLNILASRLQVLQVLTQHQVSDALRQILSSSVALPQQYTNIERQAREMEEKKSIKEAEENFSRLLAEKEAANEQLLEKLAAEKAEKEKYRQKLVELGVV